MRGLLILFVFLGNTGEWVPPTAVFYTLKGVTWSCRVCKFVSCRFYFARKVVTAFAEILKRTGFMEYKWLSPYLLIIYPMGIINDRDKPVSLTMG